MSTDIPPEEDDRMSPHLTGGGKLKGMSDSDIEEAKKAVNCLVFAINDASVLADVKRIMQGLIDECERLRSGRAAVWAECVEECAKVADEYVGEPPDEELDLALEIADEIRALTGGPRD